MADATLIGIDVGTTATKAVLIDLTGRKLAAVTRPHAMSRPAEGHAEQDPGTWLASVVAALEEFSAAHDLSGLQGIGICSQVNTHVFVDAQGAPLLPAITWQDTRCAPDAAALDAQVTAAQKLHWFGGPVPIDASHALARIAHIRRTQPGLWERTRHVLLPKDFCAFHLTGEVGSDPISAVGLVDRNGYVAPLLALVPGAKDRLPPLYGFSHVIGTVRPGLPCAGIAVVVGAMDAWAGMFGVGVASEGEAMCQCGTSEIPGIVSNKVDPTPGVILFPPYEGIVMHAAPTQSGGAALAWFGNVLGRNAEEMSAMAQRVAPSEIVPLFLPHLQGERAPIWDNTTRGVFARLENRAGAAEMVRAVMEGVALSVRWAFDALEQSAQVVTAIVNIGGGGANSDVWCQIRSDALGKPLRRAQAPEIAAIGAAMLAGVGTGAIQSIAAAARELVRFDKTFEPDPALRGYYGEKSAKYRELYETLKPFNR
ncbi:MAG: FGGY family carbohydrate kinase [Devosia sp.]